MAENEANYSVLMSTDLRKRMTIAAANNSQPTSDFSREALQAACQRIEEAEKDRLQGIITKTGQLITDKIKYFEARGLEFDIKCPECGEQFTVDLGELGFLEYPEIGIGDWDKIEVTCNGHIVNVEFKLDLWATMSVKVA